MNPKQNPAHAEKRGLSFVLAVLMHVILAGALLLSVQWKTQKPKPVVVELWGGPPPAAPEQAQPEPVKPKPVKVEPAKPEVVPEKVDIVTEKVKSTPKPTVKPTATPKVTPAPTATPKATPKATAVPKATNAPAAKPSAAPKTKATAAPKKNSEMQDLLSLDNTMASNSSNHAKSAAGGKPGGTGNNPNATSGMGSGSSGLGRGYVDGIGNRIKLNIVYPNEIVGNPEVIYKIMLFPSGEIRDIQLLKASGNKAWDEAVKSAITRSAPFQKPPNNASFSEFSGVEWKFRPK